MVVGHSKSEMNTQKDLIDKQHNRSLVWRSAAYMNFLGLFPIIPRKIAQRMNKGKHNKSCSLARSIIIIIIFFFIIISVSLLLTPEAHLVPPALPARMQPRTTGPFLSWPPLLSLFSPPMLHYSTTNSHHIISHAITQLVTPASSPPAWPALASASALVS